MRLRQDGWLEEGGGVRHIPSPRTCALEHGPEAVVWHWTGGPALGPAYAPALAQEIATFDRDKDRPASWHFLVAKDGRVFQSVPTLLGSWHVGMPGYVGGEPHRLNTGGWRVQSGRFVPNANSATIGIELENSGRLTVVDHGVRCEGYPHHPIPVERAVHHRDGWFDEFPAAQVAAATELLRALVEHHGLSRSASSAGHCMYDPAHREDPGPLWLERHLPLILDAVFPLHAAALSPPALP